ncbi:type II secretion system F family protein [Acidiphilium iwatense]|uniref:Type II secretion system F family protein n=1 Tax=Acidiphilium iwatense TaxID=768198 RepID=A0ABS9DS28_9PROT|nr:type II secretion system F family protein [Acidiphilium iwatense]MCF3945487.1 type II secretion system F family protein [Acidiphilium iwatense]
MTDLPVLLALSLIMTIGLVFLAVNVVHADRHERRMGLRLSRVTTGLIVQDTDRKPESAKILERFHRPFDLALSCIGIDRKRALDYPAPWWAILIGVGAAGRAVAFLASMMFGGIGTALWPLATIMIARFVFGSIHARRSSVLLNQFPDVLATIVRCVRVGIPVQEALRIIARDMPRPTAVEFAHIADQVSIGTPLDQALKELAGRSRLPEYGFFATALSLQARSGGGLAQTLETLAEVIRKRVAMKARGYALAAEARTSAMILGAIPIVAGLGIELLQPKYMAVLFISRKGRFIFGAAVGMLMMGTLTMRTIIRRSLS